MIKAFEKLQRSICTDSIKSHTQAITFGCVHFTLVFGSVIAGVVERLSDATGTVSNT